MQQKDFQQLAGASQFLQRLDHPDLNQRLQAITEERLSWLTWKPFAAIRDLLPKVPHLEGDLSFKQGWVEFGKALEASSPEYLAIEAAAKALMPWKKGPFNLWGVEVDAEWRSDFKWDRLCDHLPSLQGLDVLDVGCHNGYYMYRMLEQQPASVLGIDPVPRLWYQFHLMQKLLKPNSLEFQLWGWQQMEDWDALFDSIFCMGILYHHSDPIGLLRTLYKALRPGGFLVMETIVIPGEQAMCLVPEDRYAKMRNVWFLPTVPACENMLTRTKFKEVVCLADEVHTPQEQRSTSWHGGPSHEDFMMADNPEKTLEGHPAPRRAIFLARKA